MPFKVTLSPTYKAEVVVTMPNETGGNDTSKFKLTLNRYTVEQLEGEGGMKSLQQAEVLRKAIVGWEGLTSDEGEEFTFSAGNLETLMTIPQAMKAMSEAFWLTQYSAKQKN